MNNILNTSVLSWSTISELYSSIIGKCLFLLSSIAIVTTIPLSIYAISTRSMAISLLGAIVISISYLIYKIKIPRLISSFTEKEYYESLVIRKKRKALDMIHEFSILENDSMVNKLPVFLDRNYKLQIFESIKNHKTVLGEERALHALSIIKFCYMEEKDYKSRLLVSHSFYFGCFCFYSPGIFRVMTVILKGVS